MTNPQLHQREDLKERSTFGKHSQASSVLLEIEGKLEKQKSASNYQDKENVGDFRMITHGRNKSRKDISMNELGQRKSGQPDHG